MAMDYVRPGQYVKHTPSGRVGIIVDIKRRRIGNVPGVAIVRFQLLKGAETIAMTDITEATGLEMRQALNLAAPLVTAEKSSDNATAS